MKNLEFLVAAYSAIWLLIGIYFINIGKKTSAIEKKLQVYEEEKEEKIK